MKEIKTKMEAMLQAKLAEGTNFKDEITKILGESNLTESVQSQFTDVTESLIVKFGTELANELVESVELDLANEIVDMEENVNNYTEYVSEEIESSKDEYSKFLTEKAEAYVEYIDTGFETFTEEMDQTAADYCEYVNEHMNSIIEDRMQESQEKLDKYIDYVAESYMSENTESIETSIKENLLDSLVGDLRVVFEKHNLELPKEINVVEELEEDLSESEATIDKLVDKVNDLKKELNVTKQQIRFNESTKDLTESQRERVLSIVERVELSDEEYSDKLESICEMVTGTKSVTNNDLIVEGRENYEIITEEFDSEQHSEPKQDINMQAYIAAAQNFAK